MRKPVTFYLLLVALFISCSEIPKSIVVDEQGKPVPGSIYYVEARGYWDKKVYDFAFYQVNDAGEVPDEPLYVAFRLCKFVDGLLYAPGKVSRNMDSISMDIDEEAVSGKIENPLETDSSYNPQVFDLTFPFENQPCLRKRLYAEKYRPLREAFMAMYKQERIRLFELNTESLEKLKARGVPVHIRKKISDIMGTCKVKYFPWLVEKALGKRDADKYYSLVLSSAKRITDGYRNEELKKIRSLEKLEEEIKREREAPR